MRDGRDGGDRGDGETWRSGTPPPPLGFDSVEPQPQMYV